MTKYKRFTGKLFGGNATATGDNPQIAQFGSAQEGTYLGTTDPEVIQNLPAWGQGWIGAVTPDTQYPALPEMTGAMKVLSHQINGILQQGVSEWDNGTVYYTSNYCQKNGNLYISQTDENQGNDPETDKVNWKDYRDTIPIGSDTQKGIVQVDNETIKANDGVISVPIGSDTQKGVVQVDGTSIVAKDGVLSALASGASIPYGTEIALASTIDYVPVGCIPTNGNEYNAEDFTKFYNDYLVGENIEVAKLGNLTAVKVGTTDWVDITYGNGKYIAVGNTGYITTSTDGINWTDPIQVGTYNWRGIAYGNGRFIVVGERGYVSTSTDGGESWITPKQVGGSNNFNGIIYANGIFVAVANSGYLDWTDNYITWNLKQVGTSPWYSVIYEKEKFIAVGYLGQTTTSTDGKNWNTVVDVLEEPSSFNSIVYGKGRFVALTYKGTTITTNGAGLWTGKSNTNPRGSSYNWAGLVFANGVYIAKTTSSTTSTGYAISTDGINWSYSTVTQNTSSTINKFRFINNTFYALCSGGYIQYYKDGTQTINKNLIETVNYTDYATEISLYGECSKFGLDKANNKFKAPTKYNIGSNHYIYVKDTLSTPDEWIDFINSQNGNINYILNRIYSHQPKVVEKWFNSGSSASSYIVYNDRSCIQTGVVNSASTWGTVEFYIPFVTAGSTTKAMVFCQDFGGSNLDASNNDKGGYGNTIGLSDLKSDSFRYSTASGRSFPWVAFGEIEAESYETIIKGYATT